MPPACLNHGKSSPFLGAGVINTDQHVRFTKQRHVALQQDKCSQMVGVLWERQLLVDAISMKRLPKSVTCIYTGWLLLNLLC